MSAMSNSTSVVIPAYNSEDYLAETLSAILAQTVPPGEVIVVDDGSTDATGEIAESFGGIIRCFHTENQGQGSARAFGIQQTDADYIALCDSDDIWDAEHLERRWQLIAGYPDADLTFSDCYAFGPNGDPSYSRLAEAPSAWMVSYCELDAEGFYILTHPYGAMLEFNPICCSGMVFRRESYLKMGGFKPEYSRWIGEDSEFTRRFASMDEVVIAGDSRRTWGYRRHAGNHSLVQWRNVKARADILEEHLYRKVVPAEYIDQTATVKDATKCRAFDQAYLEKARDNIGDLFCHLPRSGRNYKRRLKMLLGRTGVFI